MTSPYKYNLRPAFGSKELLLQFSLDSNDTEFEKDLFKTLNSINPQIESIEDLWMNDEVFINVNSENGEFIFSKDIWGFAFIMSETNQSCIKLIDQLLNDSIRFEKVEVDFNNFAKP